MHAWPIAWTHKMGFAVDVQYTKDIVHDDSVGMSCVISMEIDQNEKNIYISYPRLPIKVQVPQFFIISILLRNNLIIFHRFRSRSAAGKRLADKRMNGHDCRDDNVIRNGRRKRAKEKWKRKLVNEKRKQIIWD